MAVAETNPHTLPHPAIRMSSSAQIIPAAAAPRAVVVPALGKRRRTLASGGAWYDASLVKAGGGCPDALLAEAGRLTFNDRTAHFMSFHNNALPRDKVFVILPGPGAPPGVYPRYKYPGWQWSAVPTYVRLDELDGDFPELERLVAHAQLEYGPFNMLIVTRYVDGDDNITWHTDKTEDFAEGGVILSYSLGAARAFELRPIGSKGTRGIETVMMEHGSGVVLSRAGNETHQHRLRKQQKRELAKQGPVGVRYSLIFRNIATLVDDEEIRQKQRRKAKK